MYIVIGILAGIIILQFIIMWKYQRQVKDICRQLAFMMKHDSNMLINHEFDAITGKRIEGTGCYDSDFSTPGYFHQFAPDYDEFESGPGNKTVAIIENEDGTIVMLPPNLIKFVLPIKNELPGIPG